MEHKYVRMFVLDDSTSLATTGGSQALTLGQVGIYGPSNVALTAAPTGLQAPYIQIAQGSGDAAMGSFKTNRIYLKNITNWYGTSSADNDKEQITYVGYDEVNDCLSPSVACDEEYTVTIRIDEHYINNVFQPYLTESFTAKTACCDDCEGGCGDLDAKPLFDKLLEKIQDSPRISPYVTVAEVSKLISGSPAAGTFTLTLPDPGTNVGGITDVMLDTTAATGFTDGPYTGITMTSTSGSGSAATYDFTVAGGVLTAVTINAAGTGYVVGEVITFAGTKITGGTTPADDFTITVTSTSSPEGLILTDLRDMYVDYVDDPETDIIITADTDGDQDANSTGNIQFEMTPSAGIDINDVPPYMGVDWVLNPCEDPGTAVYAVGLKFTGEAQTDLFNACKPETTPLFANKVRFKVYVTKGPVTSMGYDLPNYCDEWSVKTTQEIGYLVGSGAQIAEMERDFRNYLTPFTQKYINNEYNLDLAYFADDSLTYDLYHITYVDPTAGAGYENKTNQEYEAIIAVDSTDSTSKTAIQTVMNAWIALSPAYQGSVTL